MFEKQKDRKRKKPKVIIIKLQDEKKCWICGSKHGLEKHHIFGGANRDLSDLYGLYVYFCHDHHNENIKGDPGLHFNKELRIKLQRIARTAFEKVYGREAFLTIFMGRYINPVTQGRPGN